MLGTARRFRRQQVTLALSDALVVIMSLFLAWTGRSITADLDYRHVLPFCTLAVAAFCCSNYLFGLYHRIWRYAAATEVTVISGSTASSTLILIVVDLAWPIHRPIPLSVLVLGGFFAFAGFTGLRYRQRLWTGLRWRARSLQKAATPAPTRVLIFGAGEAGQLMAWRLLHCEEGEGYRLVGFVDDDPAKIGMLVHGRPVLGNRQILPQLVARHHVDMIVIAIHNLDSEAKGQILSICERTNARIKVLPNVFEWIEQTSSLLPLRDVTSEDLLGRRPVAIDHDVCRGLLAGRIALVTGAAGSIGSELCRQIAAFKPTRLLMLDNNESGLHDLALELRGNPTMPPISCIVGDVSSRAKMRWLFEVYRPQVVFHAAAYKHVPLMEEFPEEAVRVNVLGTLTVAGLACRYGAERFVFISTDKAVGPTSIMGATKRLGEMLVSAFASSSSTRCTGVRFGNVLGSRGSVVPIFEKQIDAGGPVTITHPEMTRYFMSIAEAVSLVIQAAASTEGGDLFVLDMGDQIHIEELAQRLIRMRGLRPGIDIALKYTGIRPGEKLHEDLTGPADVKFRTSHPSIYRVEGGGGVAKDLLVEEVARLVGLADRQMPKEATDLLWALVEGRVFPVPTSAPCRSLEGMGESTVPGPCGLGTVQRDVE